MGQRLNPDFQEFIKALQEAEVEYILIGGYAVIYYGYARTTGDLDIWVNPTSDNYLKLQKAFEGFGMPMFDMVKEKFIDVERNDIFTFGRPPVCIEIITSVNGLEFSATYKNAKDVDYDGVVLKLIDIDDLITTKKTVNRPKDQDDLEHLDE